MNPHAENLGVVESQLAQTSQYWKCKVCRDAKAEIERLEAELKSCRESNDAMHPRLVKCEEALTALLAGLDGGTFKDVNAAMLLAKEALDGSAETPMLFTREQVSPLLEFVQDVAASKYYYPIRDSQHQSVAQMASKALAKAKEFGMV